MPRNPKRQRTEKNPKSEPAPKDRRAEEAREEKKRQRFVEKEMRKEELEIEAKRAAKRQRMVSEVEIGDFLREQRNRAMVEETGNDPGQENVDGRSEDSQIQNQSQERKDLEYEYVTSHDDLAHRVNEHNTTPKLVSYEIGAESEVDSEQERAISPLYAEYYEEEVLDEWPPKAKGSEDGEIKEEVVRVDARQVDAQQKTFLTNCE